MSDAAFAPDGAPAMEWVILFEKDGGSACVDVCETNGIDAAITAFVASGGTRDELLHLRMVEGTGIYRVLVSRLTSFYISDPAFRRANLERLKAARDEAREMKSELGLPWSEDD